MIPAGTTITFQVAGSTGIGLTGFGTSPDSVRNDVTAYLSGFFDVYSVTVNAESLLQSAIEFSWNWTYTATVTLGTREDYGSVDDIGSIVAHAFYQAGGALPTVSAPDYGEPTQGQLPVNQGPNLGGFLQGLQGTTALLVVGLVVLVGLLAFGPNVKAIVRKVPG